jgi:hypothetical protein
MGLKFLHNKSKKIIGIENLNTKPTMNLTMWKNFLETRNYFIFKHMIFNKISRWYGISYVYSGR